MRLWCRTAMLLTVRTTRRPARDLGFLLHKHPDRVQRFSLKHGVAHVFYPEANDAACTAALLLEVDPVGLVRGPRGRGADASGPLRQYVNDRPFAASSFLSVAIAQVFGSALSGRCSAHPELAEAALPLEARLPVVPSRGGEGLLRDLFEPLGYAVETAPVPLDETHPEWGASPYFALTLSRTGTLRELLAHLYVLIPVLDADKHYYIGQAEVEKLLRHGEGWLKDHPAVERIAHRYLKRRRSLALQALERLREGDGAEESQEAFADPHEAGLEKPLRLNTVRMATVRDRLLEVGARRVVDLGCGEGRLVRLLLRHARFSKVVGVDASSRALEIAERRLRLHEMAPRMRERVDLLQGALTYRDRRLEDFDAAVLVEVIEHIDPSRLEAVARVVFGYSRPRVVIVTTPNVEYNARFENLVGGQFRHRDHRFEWTRAEFRSWAEGVAERYGYAFAWRGIGDEDPQHGPPTQMATFELSDVAIGAKGGS